MSTNENVPFKAYDQMKISRESIIRRPARDWPHGYEEKLAKMAYSTFPTDYGQSIQHIDQKLMGFSSRT